jgi:hypothetical protein
VNLKIKPTPIRLVGECVFIGVHVRSCMCVACVLEKKTLDNVFCDFLTDSVLASHGHSVSYIAPKSRASQRKATSQTSAHGAVPNRLTQSSK